MNLFIFIYCVYFVQFAQCGLVVHKMKFNSSLVESWNNKYDNLNNSFDLTCKTNKYGYHSVQYINDVDRNADTRVILISMLFGESFNKTTVHEFTINVPENSYQIISDNFCKLSFVVAQIMNDNLDEFDLGMFKSSMQIMFEINFDFDFNLVSNKFIA